MKRSQKISARIVLLAIMASIFMTLFQNCGGSVTLQSAPKPPPTLPPPETQSTPTVINVTSSTPDGIYNQGSVISIQVIFSEAVFVTDVMKNSSYS